MTLAYFSMFEHCVLTATETACCIHLRNDHLAWENAKQMEKMQNSGHIPFLGVWGTVKKKFTISKMSRKSISDIGNRKL